ncbi:MAG: UbiA prenyltransferase family protein, partial [Rhodanobacteraceae bacterium]
PRGSPSIRTDPMRARALIDLARPAQWIKNGFVLLPVIFAQALFDARALVGALLATLAFCLASSAVYAGNDAVDAERDRRHPDKCRRPVARGAVTHRQALLFAAMLALLAFTVATFDGRALVVVLLSYLLLQAAYTLALKRVAYVDAVVVAAGFVLRIVAGGVGAGVPLTPWIVIMGFLLALMLALGKRHGDLVHATDPRARAVRSYRRLPLEWALTAVGGATVSAYVLYTLSPQVLARHGHHPLIFSTPWVAVGLLRYLALVLRRGAGGDPSRLALSDPILLLAVGGWLLTLGVILYR